MMKLQDVLSKAMAKKIRWWEAAEIIGVTDRTMRRWRERMETDGYSGLVDRRKGKPCDRRVPVAKVEEVLWTVPGDLLMYDAKIDPITPSQVCCGTHNRGLAIPEGKIILAANDARLIALDAVSGKAARPQRLSGAARCAGGEQVALKPHRAGRSGFSRDRS